MLMLLLMSILMLINFSDYASALASAYLLFKDSDSAYAATLLGESNPDHCDANDIDRPY